MVEASINKARTASLDGFLTKAIEQTIAQGHQGFLNLPDALTVEGSAPVMIHVQLVGVAGALSSDEGAAAQNVGATLGSSR